MPPDLNLLAQFREIRFIHSSDDIAAFRRRNVQESFCVVPELSVIFRCRANPFLQPAYVSDPDRRTELALPRSSATTLF